MTTSLKSCRHRSDQDGRHVANHEGSSSSIRYDETSTITFLSLSATTEATTRATHERNETLESRLRPRPQSPSVTTRLTYEDEQDASQLDRRTVTRYGESLGEYDSDCDDRMIRTRRASARIDAPLCSTSAVAIKRRIRRRNLALKLPSPKRNGRQNGFVLLLFRLVALLICTSRRTRTNKIIPLFAHARFACSSDLDCQHQIGTGTNSICLTTGFCSNPFHRGGCLASAYAKNATLLQQKLGYTRTPLRTCHSEDPPEAQRLGYCRPSQLEYAEIRLAAQNWESVFFTNWIFQILLGEVLNVPVTIETGERGKSVDFYNLHTNMDYGVAYDYASLERGHEVKDCRKIQQLNNHNAKSDDDSDYLSCSHAIPEIWAGHEVSIKDLQQRGIVETPGNLGALGSAGWFVPRFTALGDPTLLTHFGIAGQREKMAANFLRPTTWKDYCELVSETKCEQADAVVRRKPITKTEQEMYFHADFYTGHFRNTTQNDCVKHPDNCTGHIVDFPCGWTSFVKQQAYHLDIAVESNGPEPGSNGYSYASMVQIWAAANATKSNVLMEWWQPEALFQQYLGTDAEFVKVQLPHTTQDCIEHRVSTLDRCSSDFATQVGDPRGSCAEAPHSLTKLVGTAIRELSENPTIASALHSPAYETIEKFRISDLQFGKIFQLWFSYGGRDRYHLDPREAVCDWVVENLDELLEFVPDSHPRVAQDDHRSFRKPILLIAMVLACLAIVGTMISAVLTYLYRHQKVMRLAQPRFLAMLLTGLLLVSLGSLLNVLEPSDSICVLVVWLVNFGYTLELVPLIVKVAAINRLMTLASHNRAGRRRHVHQVKEKHLNGAVLLIAVLVGIGLMAWTILDPPSKKYDVSMSAEKNAETGETIVKRCYFCASDNEFWNYLAATWQLILLLSASVLAFQTRKVSELVEDINESRTLGLMIYSHFVFVSLRATTYFLESKTSNSAIQDDESTIEKADQTTFAAARSIIFAVDTIATLIIYFAPKFFKSFGGSVTGTNIESSQFPMTEDGTAGERRPPPLKQNVRHEQKSERKSDSKELIREALMAARKVHQRFSQASSSVYDDESSKSSSALASAGTSVERSGNFYAFIRDSVNMDRDSSPHGSDTQTSNVGRSSGGSNVGSHASSGRGGTSMQYLSMATSLATVSEQEGTEGTDDVTRIAPNEDGSRSIRVDDSTSLLEVKSEDEDDPDGNEADGDISSSPV